jgi:hypothetical protein
MAASTVYKKFGDTVRCAFRRMNDGTHPCGITKETPKLEALHVVSFQMMKRRSTDVLQTHPRLPVYDYPRPVHSQCLYRYHKIESLSKDNKMNDDPTRTLHKHLHLQRPRLIFFLKFRLFQGRASLRGWQHLVQHGLHFLQCVLKQRNELRGQGCCGRRRRPCRRRNKL